MMMMMLVMIMTINERNQIQLEYLKNVAILSSTVFDAQAILTSSYNTAISIIRSHSIKQLQYLR